MYLDKKFTVPKQSEAHKQLSHFLLNHAPGLISAARLLGGRAAVRRTGALIERIPSSPHLTRRDQAELIALHRLLSLQDVHVIDSVEAECFALIEPASPVIEDICLLTDQLEDHLEATSNEDRNSNSPAS